MWCGACAAVFLLRKSSSGANLLELAAGEGGAPAAGLELASGQGGAAAALIGNLVVAGGVHVGWLVLINSVTGGGTLARVEFGL